MSRCNLCGGKISDRNDSRFCVHCNSTFHKGCITKHFYHNKYCPVCNEKMSLLFMRRGFPPVVKEEPAPREATKAEVPSYPPVEKRPVQREIREPEWRQPERRPRVSAPRSYTPARPRSTDRFGRKSRKGYPRGKSLKDILSEAVGILKENRIIVVPYLIPFILLFIGSLVGFGQFISVQDQFLPTEQLESMYGEELESMYGEELESMYGEELESMYGEELESMYGEELRSILTEQWESMYGEEYSPNFSYRFFSVFPTFTSIIGILHWVFSVIAVAIAIEMTYFSVQRKKITLSGVWNEIGTERLAMLLIVDFILVILIGIPRMLVFPIFSISKFVFIFIIELTLGMFFLFVFQGILIDYLGVGATIYNSCKVAKRNFLSILILVLFFTFVTDAVDVSIIKEVLKISVALYGTVAFTLLYLDRT